MGNALPRWVLLGAAALAAIAGMVNVVGYLGFEHQAITHLTGTTSLLGAALSGQHWRTAFELAAMAMAFVLGAALSGVIIQDSVLRLGRRYGVALALEAVLLALSIPLFEQRQLAGAILAAIACGLQNAMATTYSGAVVRTSHLSGMYTDLGIALGHAARGMPVPRRRLALSALVIGGFLCGGVVGAWLFARIAYDALWLPAACTGTVGVAYAIYHHLALRTSAR